ncbi:hypothetical protein J5N97_008569 [Dioscorea zingiberensis]|uniref:Dof zinc finger protein n=1 Tax=Dioscorea zingiberensis TaxID=325984 RepID=A0A9D5HKW5_9LILI|nr:hypothetical protein J5N97_000947 [Dioscorea zingiberensis]KAJ0980314.1 hypothetical protein J5N97_008569 [Dioscorea zingiberensis]
MSLDSGEGRRRVAAAGEKGGERCPRCESRDTKFCYYNNYNTAQPRHFCRACRRYWTLGGALRNVPIGGSSRKRPRHVMPPLKPASRPACMVPMEFTGRNRGFGAWLAGAPPFLALGELGLGLGLGCGSQGEQHAPGMEEELGFGLSSEIVWPPALVDADGGDTWRVHGGGSECFAVPNLAAAWAEQANSKGGTHSGL